MRLFRKILLLFIFISILNTFVSAQNIDNHINTQGFLKAEGKQIVNEQGQNILLRGIGLGGWMVQEGYMLHVNENGQQHKIKERIETLIGTSQTEEFYDAWLSNHTTKIDIDSLHAWGFNSVRLPMHFNLYTLALEKEPINAQNTWLKKGFTLTDSILSWCKANKMYLILDLHAAPGGQGSDLTISDGDTSKPSLWASEANQLKTIALWKEIAKHYLNEPWIGGYDILNEPNYGFANPLKDKNGFAEMGNEPLKKLLTAITNSIREVDKKHLIIIEGNGYGNNYNGILPLWDNNMVLSFHKYWNFNDQKSIQNILNIREKYNVPVWLGETGENSNVWFTEAIRLFEKNNIGWSWWPLKKMGVNNPLEIKSNLNYDALTNYWNGTGKMPKKSNVYKGLMELATSSKLENNIYHKDVIDAMMRQPFSDVIIPFNINLINDNTIIKAVAYDMGKNGIAYNDTDTADYWVAGKKGIGNRGRIFRNDGVDIYKDTAQQESYYVSDIEKGEWLQFTVDVIKKGNYALAFEVAADKTGGKISILSGLKTLIQNIDVPLTGAFNKWQFTTFKNVVLEKGRQEIKVFFVNGGFNFKSMKFIKAGK